MRWPHALLGRHRGTEKIRKQRPGSQASGALLDFWGLPRYAESQKRCWRRDPCFPLPVSYIAGAHPEILRRLMETNLEPLPGYGSDPDCRSAAEKILSACGCPEGQVRFLVGGTQTNQLVIDTLLRPWEGVLSAADRPRQRPRGRGHRVLRSQGPDPAPGERQAPLGGCGSLLRRLLRRREPRAHGLPRHGLPLLSPRSTAPSTRNRSLPPSPGSAGSGTSRLLSGRRPAGLRPHEPRATT